MKATPINSIVRREGDSGGGSGCRWRGSYFLLCMLRARSKEFGLHFDQSALIRRRIEKEKGRRKEIKKKTDR